MAPKNNLVKDQRKVATNKCFLSDNSDSSSVKSSGRQKLKLESTESPTETGSPSPVAHRTSGLPEKLKQPEIHQPYKNLITSSSTLPSSSSTHFAIPGLPGRYPPIYPGLPAPPPSAFYPPTSSGAALLSSYFGTGMTTSSSPLMPSHPASHLSSVSPYIPAPQPASASSIHSFLAAIEAASAVAQLQQQQQQQQLQQLQQKENSQGKQQPTK